MKVKIEHIENQTVTCKIKDHNDAIADAPQKYFDGNVKAGDIIETRFEYQGMKESFRH